MKPWLRGRAEVPRAARPPRPGTWVARRWRGLLGLPLLLIGAATPQAVVTPALAPRPAAKATDGLRCAQAKRVTQRRAQLRQAWQHKAASGLPQARRHARDPLLEHLYRFRRLERGEQAARRALRKRPGESLQPALNTALWAVLRSRKARRDKALEAVLALPRQLSIRGRLLRYLARQRRRAVSRALAAALVCEHGEALSALRLKRGSAKARLRHCDLLRLARGAAHPFERALKQAQELSPQALCGVVTARIKALYTQRERDAALQFAQRYPQCAGSKLRWYRMRAHADLGQTPAALKEAEQLAAHFPASALADDALYFAARLAEGHGQGTRATQLLDALDALPKAGDAQQKAQRFRVLQAQFREDATGVLRLSRGSKDATLRWLRARALGQLGRKQEARDVLQALAQGPPSLARWALREQEATWLPELRTPSACAEPASELRAASTPQLELLLDLLAVGERRLGKRLLGQHLRALASTQAATALAALACAGEVSLALQYSAARRGQRFESLRYPLPFKAAFESAAETSGLPVAFLYALARTESRFDPKARSRADARGLMQLMPAVAQKHWPKRLGRFRRARLYEAKTNLQVATGLLHALRTHYDGHLLRIAAAYNAGQARVDGWLRSRPAEDAVLWAARIPYRETRRYVQRVLTAMLHYEARLKAAPSCKPRSP